MLILYFCFRLPHRENLSSEYNSSIERSGESLAMCGAGYPCQRNLLLRRLFPPLSISSSGFHYQRYRKPNNLMQMHTNLKKVDYVLSCPWRIPDLLVDHISLLSMMTERRHKIPSCAVGVLAVVDEAFVREQKYQEPETGFWGYPPGRSLWRALKTHRNCMYAHWEVLSLALLSLQRFPVSLHQM